MSAYYENQQQQWGQGSAANSWDQTPPNRSATSSAALPREHEANAFQSQFEEVDKAQDNLMKSGKVFHAGMPGARRESLPQHGPPRGRQQQHLGHGDARMGPGSRPHSAADFGEHRGGINNPGNVQNYYASARHQPSRGSNEAEQMIQAKRRQAAQRERELRNYHQEQQYNRTVLSDISTKPERALSPGSMSEEQRRKLIANQRSALYGEGPFVDETGTPHPGMPGPPNGPGSLRGHSPLAYDFGRTPPIYQGQQQQPPADGGAGPSDPARTNSTSSPQPPQQQQQQVSPPSGSPSLGSGGANSKPGQGGPAVAPIGTRPAQPTGQRQTPPVPSSLNQGFGSGDNDSSAGGQSNSSPADGRNGNMWGGRNNSVWNNSSASGQQHVWGTA